MINIKRILPIVILATALLCTIGVAENQKAKVDVFPVSMNNYNPEYVAEIRGIALKFELLDSLSELFSTCVTGVSKEALFQRSDEDYEHYQWMWSVYNAFSPSQKEILGKLFNKQNVWLMLDALKTLPDDADIDMVLSAISASSVIQFQDSKHDLVIPFLRDYYVSSLSPYLSKREPIINKRMAYLNDALINKPFEVMSYMEDMSGIQFPQKFKPVLYYTLRSVGAMGFDIGNESITLIQSTVDEEYLLFCASFHEYGHILFDTFARNSQFEMICKTITENDLEMVKVWEKDFSMNYDWIGWCEENLIEGFAHYLDEQYYGYIATKPTYVYDLKFYQYLNEIKFDPSSMSLEQVSFDFYLKLYK